MVSHFSSVGVVGDRHAVGRAVLHAATHGRTSAAPDGRRVAEWTDAASGASLAVVLDPSGAVECAKPYVAHSGRAARTRLSSVVEDPDCAHCSVLLVEVLDDRDELVYPLGVELPDLAGVGPTLRLGEPAALRVSGIAEQLELFPDEPAHRASGTPFAVHSLVPSGLFTLGPAHEGDTGGVRAEALLSGVVVAATRRRNGFSGGGFWHLLVETLELQVDLAVDPGLLVADPVPGSICSVTAWLVGRLSS